MMQLPAGVYAVDDGVALDELNALLGKAGRPLGSREVSGGPLPIDAARQVAHAEDEMERAHRMLDVQTSVLERARADLDQERELADVCRRSAAQWQHKCEQLEQERETARRQIASLEEAAAAAEVAASAPGPADIELRERCELLEQDNKRAKRRIASLEKTVAAAKVEASMVPGTVLEARTRDRLAFEALAKRMETQAREQSKSIADVMRICARALCEEIAGVYYPDSAAAS